MDDNNSEIENRRRNRTSNKPSESDSWPAAQWWRWAEKWW